jgi:hypothetical protein
VTVDLLWKLLTNSELWSGAAGVILGSCIPLYWLGRARRIERAGELVAVRAELAHAHEYMTALRTPVKGQVVISPLYRLPTSISDRAVPKLIGEGLLKPAEISALIDYMVRIEELNRGLDRARAEKDAGDAILEYNRNVAKIAHILDDKVSHGSTRYALAVTAIGRLQIQYPPRRND